MRTNYKAIHFGNSGSMEVSGAIEIFQCSESLHGLRYTKFLGDGDARAYKAVNEMQPYGDTGIEKLECVGYVKKRMETRLRALKLKMKREVYKHKNILPSEVLNYIKYVCTGQQLTSLPKACMFRETFSCPPHIRSVVGSTPGANEDRRVEETDVR
ncbi:uncharacterized protein LOC100901629 [Trichonephila clavipes]|nr:uncharacterized protein LOC100901629 [Trichonephila clavipes]